MRGNTAPTSGTPGRLRLGFLDGIRGLAALYVVIFHALTIELDRADRSVSPVMRALRAVFGYGHYAVCVFIVLSGFSLMLPIARSGSLRLDRSFRSYLHRRSRRILPAYYAALALSIVAIVVADAAMRQGGNDEALSFGSVVSHLLLLHSLSFDWAFRINGPMWSVATEWYIYFLFPLVILPLWRRIGGVATVSLTWLAPLALDVLVSDERNFFWAAPWFVGSFAFGMACALIAYTDPGLVRRRWEVLGLGALVVVVVQSATPSLADLRLIYPDFVVSVMTVGLIMACVRHVTVSSSATTLAEVDREPAGSGRLTGFLGAPAMLSLGAFSYSLYLVQHPLLRLSEAAFDRTSLGYEAILWLQLVLVVPAVMGLARIFAEFFEMPFTSGSWVVDALRRPFGSGPAVVAAPATVPVAERTGGSGS